MEQMRPGEHLTNRSVIGLALIAGSAPAFALLAPQSPPAVVLAIGICLAVSVMPILGAWAGVLLLPILGLIPGADWVGVGLGSVPWPYCCGGVGQS